jgi:MoaA/NifB/PqqE/SkfB family radical SAM enzyme
MHGAYTGMNQYQVTSSASVREDMSSQRTSRQVKLRLGPDGLHVFHRKSGLNILVDEATVPPSMWSAAPRHVSIALTNTCDSSCAYCFAPKRPATLSFERLVEWLRELDANGCLGVGFGGGEPSLYPRLAELCRVTAHQTGLAVTMTSNGYHLDEAMLGSLADNVNYLRLSMDGVGATYEKLRGMPFDFFLHRLNSVRQFLPFGINYVVNSQTFPDLDSAITLATSVGATGFLLLPERPTDTSVGIDPNTRSAFEQWVAGYRGTLPLAVSESDAAGLPVCDPNPAERGLRSYAHIDAEGCLKRSSFDRHGVAIGLDGVLRALESFEPYTEGMIP